MKKNEHDQDDSSLLKTYGIQPAKVFLKKLNLLDTENQENLSKKTFFDTEIGQIENIIASKSEDSAIQETKKKIAMSSAGKLPVLLEEKPKHLKDPSIKIEPIVNSKPPNHKYNKQELPCVNNIEKSNDDTQPIIEKNNIQKKFYSCRFCHKSFNHQLDMFEHEWKHTNEKSFGNSVQKEKNFVQKVGNYVQKENIKSVQVNFKQSNVNASYHCNQCNLNFDRKLALKLHEKRIHKSKIHKKSTNSPEIEYIVVENICH